MNGYQVTQGNAEMKGAAGDFKELLFCKEIRSENPYHTALW